MHRSAPAVERTVPDNSTSIAVVIPVKSFDLAKGRLAPTVTPDDRASLARTMAEGVVGAARPLTTFVVCGSTDVAAWAIAADAGVIWLTEPGLNRAITHAAGVLSTDGYRRMIVAHGDLPLARSLAWVGDSDGVTIVPDRRGQGTNVMAVPLGTDFVFRYGPASAPAHEAEARRCDLTVRVIPDESLGWDIDTPADLSDLSDLSDRKTR